MAIIRKPHNLVTEYWDDTQYFLQYAETIERQRTDKSLPFDKRGCRYSMLSSFLFLEAFINAEYVDRIHPTTSITDLSNIQKHNLDEMLMNTLFEVKWNAWVKMLANDNTLNFKGDAFFQWIQRDILENK